ncbi:MAG: FmdB family zinc ribbon protein [Spirochaetota bacterium]
MPVYEFKCSQCGHIFSELRKMGDFSSGKCPVCGSEVTEKVFSLFASAGSDKGGNCAPSAGGG